MHHDEILTLNLGLFKALHGCSITPCHNYNLLKHDFIGILLSGIVREYIPDISADTLASLENYLGPTNAQEALSTQLFAFSITSTDIASCPVTFRQPLALYFSWIPEYAKEFKGAYIQDLVSAGIVLAPSHTTISTPALPSEARSLAGSHVDATEDNL